MVIKMKKLLVIIVALIIICGGAGVWYFVINDSDGSGTAGTSDAEVEQEGAQETIKSDGKTYYEADYVENSANRVKNLTFKVPSDFTGITSDDDSVNENLYINKKTGTKLSIREQHSKSKSAYEKEAKEYLDGASNIKKFKVGNYTACKFQYKTNKDVTEYDFYIVAGSTFYSGFIYHETNVKDEQSEEPDPIALTDDEIKSFDNLCDSLSLK